MKRRFCSIAAMLSLAMLSIVPARAHNLGIFGEWPMNWHTDQISRVLAYGMLRRGETPGRLTTLGGKTCLEGSWFSFDVSDRYAFDIDETVHLEIEFYPRNTASKVEISYEGHEGVNVVKAVQVPAAAGAHTHKETIVLERARFANRDIFKTDFSIGSNFGGQPPPVFTICNVILRRSYSTPVPEYYGTINLNVLNETGRAVPARVGIYDAAGRLPLPSSDAIEVKRFHDVIRVVTLPSPSLQFPNYIPWPARNPSVFYINGSYRAKLPVGQYELAIAKGPEYRMVHRTFRIEKDQPKTISVNLRRWDNLPAKGWWSGEGHIHYERNNEREDRDLLIFSAAEDLHVSNILQMGNIAGIYFKHHSWDSVTSREDSAFVIVPGQEDPRTARLGHTIQLNLPEPLHPKPQHYLAYQDVFERARMLNATTGYAHQVAAGEVYGFAGIALDVPLGLVDFAEVMQRGVAGPNIWFDFLNLGYKLAPVAGTDFPYGSIPGAERSYVRAGNPFTAQAWFDGLKRGETFVTNGPLLELHVNGKGMGSELRLSGGEKIIIDVTATINPDVDTLERLELIEQGQVIKTSRAKSVRQTTLQLRHETIARNGTWFVAWVYGKTPRESSTSLFSGSGPARAAISGAVYIYVDGKSFWKPSAVPLIVDRIKKDLKQMSLSEKERPESCCELWEAEGPSLHYWDSQEKPLKQRVDQAIKIYDDLVNRAAQEISGQSQP